MKKATRFEKQGSQSQGHYNNPTSTLAPTKIARVLSHLLYEGTLNHFEAGRIGDHFLNSTISTLANGYGVLFERQPEQVANKWGEPCEVVRYRIAGAVRPHAECVLARLLKRPPDNRI